MSGVAIILELAASGINVRALIDPDQVPSRISGDVLGTDTVLPALQVEKISGRDLHVFSSGKRHRTERVQVTCHADSRPGAAELLAAVRADCADRRGTIAGFTNVAVITDGEGPQGTDPTTFARTESQDFRVSYNEPR